MVNSSALEHFVSDGLRRAYLAWARDKMHRMAAIADTAKRSWWALAAIAAVAAPVAAWSQPQTAGERLEFEVASLKPTAPGAIGFSIVPVPGGRLRARNIPLKRLVAVAYSITDHQILSDLKWFESQGYDMEAKAPGPAALPQLRLMLQSLLDERFKLKLHRETKEMSIYSLLPAKNGTPGGPGLVRTADGDCSAAVGDQAALPNGTPCGVVNIGPGRINGQRGRISQLCDRLSTLLGRPVVDKTGLTGNFNIAVTWTPDPELERQATEAKQPDVSGPSLFTSLQEQLGLKLVAGKGPVEVIVVDAADRSAGN
jgi:uncharacterized protein (TIGR03435 family)